MELIFVHGALVNDGQWWWRRAADLLEARTGIKSRSLRLPSCGEGDDTSPTGGLITDAEELRRALDQVDSAIVVGHSYGGTVIAEAGHHPAIAHLLYISSYLPDMGQAQAAIMSDEPDPVSVGDNGDGTLALVGYDAESFGARFLQDAEPVDAAEAWERVTAQSLEAFITPTSREGWRGVDSTYLVCAEDRSTSLALQRFHASRASRSVDLPTGHHPFLSRPDLVVRQIEAVLKQL